MAKADFMELSAGDGLVIAGGDAGLLFASGDAGPLSAVFGGCGGTRDAAGRPAGFGGWAGLSPGSRINTRLPAATHSLNFTKASNFGK